MLGGALDRPLHGPVRQVMGPVEDDGDEGGRANAHYRASAQVHALQ